MFRWEAPLARNTFAEHAASRVPIVVRVGGAEWTEITNIIHSGSSYPVCCHVGAFPRKTKNVPKTIFSVPHIYLSSSLGVINISANRQTWTRRSHGGISTLPDSYWKNSILPDSLRIAREYVRNCIFVEYCEEYVIVYLFPSVFCFRPVCSRWNSETMVVLMVVLTIAVFHTTGR